MPAWVLGSNDVLCGVTVSGCFSSRLLGIISGQKTSVENAAVTCTFLLTTSVTEYLQFPLRERWGLQAQSVQRFILHMCTPCVRTLRASTLLCLHLQHFALAYRLSEGMFHVCMCGYGLSSHISGMPFVANLPYRYVSCAWSWVWRD